MSEDFKILRELFITHVQLCGAMMRREQAEKYVDTMMERAKDE